MTTSLDVSFEERETGIEMPSLHYHSSYEIYLLVSGSRRYIIGDRLYDIEQADVILIKPDKLHKTSGGGFKRYLINFGSDYLYSYFTRPAVEQLISCFRNTKISLTQHELQYVLSILNRPRRDEKLDFLFLAEILTFLGKERGESSIPVTQQNSTVARVLDYINQNYGEIDSLETVAEHFYISKCHLCRIFKSNTGVTLIKYINNVKTQKAREMLDNTKLSVTEIALECGFNSGPYFCKIFKDITHLSPMKYRSRAL